MIPERIQRASLTLHVRGKVPSTDQLGGHLGSSWTSEVGEKEMILLCEVSRREGMASVGRGMKARRMKSVGEERERDEKEYDVGGK